MMTAAAPSPHTVTLTEQVFSVILIPSLAIAICCWVIAWLKSGRRGIFLNPALPPDAVRYRAIGVVFWLIAVVSVCIVLYLMRDVS